MLSMVPCQVNLGLNFGVFLSSLAQQLQSSAVEQVSFELKKLQQYRSAAVLIIPSSHRAIQLANLFPTKAIFRPHKSPPRFVVDANSQLVSICIILKHSLRHRCRGRLHRTRHRHRRRRRRRRRRCGRRHRQHRRRRCQRRFLVNLFHASTRIFKIGFRQKAENKSFRAKTEISSALKY